MADPVHHGPTDWMPKPPPPDWTVESEVRHRDLARETEGVLRGLQRGGGTQLPNPWEVDTACRTRVAPRVARGTVGPEGIAALRVAPAGTVHDVPVAVARTIAGATHTPRRSRVVLGSFVGLLSLCCLGLAFWQLYWMLEATAPGRAILDRMAGAVASVIRLF